MALALNLSTSTADAETDTVARLLDGGYLQIYTGRQPKGGDDRVPGDSDLLAELRFQTPAFHPSENTIAVAYDLVGTIALATGKAKWFRTLRADKYTVVFDGSIGGEGDEANMLMNSPDLQQGATVSVAGFTYGSST